MTALTLTVTLSRVMTSWGGTSRVTVLRSILTSRSMPNGMMSRSPGPFSVISRPSRKSTPRSYSLMMRMAELKPISTTRTMMPRTISANMPTGPSSLMQWSSCYGWRQRLGGCRLGSLRQRALLLLHRLHSQPKAIQPENPDLGAGGQRPAGRGRLPEGPVDEDHAIRIERLADGADVTHHGLLARGVRLPPCGDDFLKDEEEDAGDAQDGNQQQRKVDGFREKAGVDQEQAAQGHRDDATGRQDAVGHGLEVDDKQQDREQDQEQARDVDGQIEEGYGSEQARDDADDARQDQAGMRHPETDPNDGQQEEQVDQVRVGHRFQQLIEAAEIVSLDPGMGGLQRVAAAALEDLPAVEVPQQCGEVAALEVDDAQMHGLVRGRVDALPDRLLHPIGVVVVKGGQRTAVGGRVVLDLLVLDVGRRRCAGASWACAGCRVTSAEADGVRRADVRAGGHHGDVGGLRDVHPGGGRARPRRRDEDHNRNRGAEHLLDDVAHGGIETAGCVQRDDQGARVSRHRLVHGIRNIVVGDRIDHAVQRGYQDMRLGRASCHGRQKPNYGDGREKEATGPLHDLMIARAERAGLRRMKAWRNAQSRDLPMTKRPITAPSWPVTHACPTTKSDAFSTPRARAATPPTAD